MKNIQHFIQGLERRFLLIHLLLFMVYLFLQLYYVFFITKQFDYMGFNREFSFVKYLEIHFFYILFVFISHYIYQKSQFLFSIFILLFLFFFIPNGILYSFTNLPRGPVYSIVIFLLTFSYISPKKLNIKPFPISNFYRNLFIFLIFGLLLIPIVWVYLGDIHLKTLLLQDIYTTRESFSLKETAMVKYFYNWLVKVIIPFMFVYFMYQRNYLLAGIGLFFLIYLFVISGNKAVYFTSIITVFFYFIGKTTLDKLYFFLGALLVSFVLIFVGDFILGDYLLRGTLIMRPFFFPALLNYCYFDYFHEFRKIQMYFSENHIFNHFFTSPLDTKSAVLIAKVYFHTDDMYANNGLISDGIMNLGYVGVFLLSGLFSLIFLLFNSLKTPSVYFGLFFICVFFFLSAPVFTVIVTGGVWILLFLMYLTMKNQADEL